MESKIDKAYLYISESLIDQLIEYIEVKEEVIDAEWGSGRNKEQIIRDNDMPELWHTLKAIKNHP